LEKADCLKKRVRSQRRNPENTFEGRSRVERTTAERGMSKKGQLTGKSACVLSLHTKIKRRRTLEFREKGTRGRCNSSHVTIGGLTVAKDPAVSKFFFKDRYWALVNTRVLRKTERDIPPKPGGRGRMVSREEGCPGGRLAPSRSENYHVIISAVKLYLKTDHEGGDDNSGGAFIVQ